MPIHKVRMFNPGDRITDALIYTIEDGHDIHCVARWALDAPRDDWFEVPEALAIRGMNVSVHFADTILRRYADRGVVALDRNYERSENVDEAEASNVEGDEKAVMAKGRKRWVDFCRAVAQRHIDQCQACRAVNMPPIPASGFTKRALEIAGFTDPADAYLAAAANKKGEIDDLKTQLAEQGKLIEKLIAAQQSGKSPEATAKK